LLILQLRLNFVNKKSHKKATHKHGYGREWLSCITCLHNKKYIDLYFKMDN